MNLIVEQSLLKKAHLSVENKTAIIMHCQTNQKNQLKSILENFPLISNWHEIYKVIDEDKKIFFYEALMLKFDYKSFVHFLNEDFDISNNFLNLIHLHSDYLVASVGSSKFTDIINTCFKNMFNTYIRDFSFIMQQLTDSSSIPFLDLKKPLYFHADDLIHYLKKYPTQIESINEKNLNTIFEAFVAYRSTENTPKMSHIFNSNDFSLLDGFKFKGIATTNLSSIIKDSSVNLTDLSQYSKITNKSLKKEFYKEIINKEIINFSPIILLKVVIEALQEVDQQKLIPLVKVFSNILFPKSDDFCAALYSLIFNLNKIGVSQEKIINILKTLNNDCESIVMDTYSLLMNSIYNFNKEKIKISILSKKIQNTSSSITKIHNLLIPFGLDQENFKFEIKKELLELDNKQVSEYNIYIPKESHDLYKASVQMNICVGNGIYSEHIKNKISNIIFLKKNDTFSYCIEIEFKSRAIMEFKGINNQIPPEYIIISLRNFLNNLGLNHKQ